MTTIDTMTQDFHYQHNDSPHDGDPARPGRYCGPSCDLYESPDGPAYRPQDREIIEEPTIGADGNDIEIDDYVAIRYDDGSQSPVLGKVLNIFIDGITYVRVSGATLRADRVVRTSIRKRQIASEKE